MTAAFDPGALITSGPLLAAVAISVAAGLVSFLSPCCLPLVPGYLAYVTGTAGAEAHRDAAPTHSQTTEAATIPCFVFDVFRRLLLGGTGSHLSHPDEFDGVSLRSGCSRVNTQRYQSTSDTMSTIRGRTLFR